MVQTLLEQMILHLLKNYFFKESSYFIKEFKPIGIYLYVIFSLTL